METTEQPGNWWSWAPRFPRWAILGAAAIFNTTAVITTYAYWPEQHPNALQDWLRAFIANSTIANFLGLAVGLQLNSEVIYMIFSKKANAEDVKDAKAAGIAQGQVAGFAAAESQFRQWYETNKDKLADIPPPPFSSNGSNGSNGRQPK